MVKSGQQISRNIFMTFAVCTFGK